MSGLIQVAGLPRSGTAFMAVFLSLCPVCVGVHELASTHEDWRSELASLLSEHRFVADCSTYAYVPQLRIPSGKRVFISQQADESRKRAELAFNFSIPEGSFDCLHDLGLEWVAEGNGMTVERSNLFSVQTLEQVWRYAFDGEIEFPRRKASVLVSMNIQRANPQDLFSMDSGLKFAAKEAL